jgi:hypothetical protein
MLKQRIKDRAFATIEEIMIAVRDVSSGVALADLQSLFFNWIERLEYVIEHEGEYDVN